MTHTTHQQTMVREFLSESSYSDEVITQGFAYADRVGWNNADHLGRLTLSRILYSDAQLADGELVGWAPVDWP